MSSTRRSETTDSQPATNAVSTAQEEAEERSRAEATLSPELRSTFTLLVDDYAVSAKIHLGQVAIDYAVLADLVRVGWRRVD
jgi:hypothetical protein